MDIKNLSFDELADVLTRKAAEIRLTAGADKNAKSSGLCCGSCVAVSNICVPDSAPNKCNGGCTVTSFLM